MTRYSLANLWHAEPTALVTLLGLILAYLAIIGVNVPAPDKLGELVGTLLAILAGGATIRSQVSSPATVARIKAGKG